MMSMLTFICQLGMKSALWRTRSKIFCSWGLMKELSGENGRTFRNKDLSTLTITAPEHILQLCHFHTAYLEYWASVLFWGQLLGLYKVCRLFVLRWPLTGEESLTEHPCLQNTQYTQRNVISSDTNKDRFNVEDSWSYFGGDKGGEVRTA